MSLCWEERNYENASYLIQLYLKNKINFLFYQTGGSDALLRVPVAAVNPSGAGNASRPKIRKFHETGMTKVDAIGPSLTERRGRKHQLAFRPVRLVDPKRACRRSFMKTEPSIYNATLSPILSYLVLGKQTR